MSSYSNRTFNWRSTAGLISVVILLLFSTFIAFSQDSNQGRRGRRHGLHIEHNHVHEAPEISDSLRAVRDSIARVDSIAAVDSINMLKKSSLDAPAFTTAKDSIIEDFRMMK